MYTTIKYNVMTDGCYEIEASSDDPGCLKVSMDTAYPGITLEEFLTRYVCVCNYDSQIYSRISPPEEYDHRWKNSLMGKDDSWKITHICISTSHILFGFEGPDLNPALDCRANIMFFMPDDQDKEEYRTAITLKVEENVPGAEESNTTEIKYDSRFIEIEEPRRRDGTQRTLTIDRRRRERAEESMTEDCSYEMEIYETRNC